MPAAARIGDNHRCYEAAPVPHRGGEVVEGCPTVEIGDMPAARRGDRAYCEGGAYDVILKGEPTVEIGGRPAARVGDATDGGRLSTGCATVQIGPDRDIDELKRAADLGAAVLPTGRRRRRR
ncbi:MAG: PAAR domain-containing protein [Polyangiaceae bacterium]|nr:PAAR domain-containing protein [Polyangiaceae bacterium]